MKFYMIVFLSMVTLFTGLSASGKTFIYGPLYEVEIEYVGAGPQDCQQVSRRILQELDLTPRRVVSELGKTTLYFHCWSRRERVRELLHTSESLPEDAKVLKVEMLKDGMPPKPLITKVEEWLFAPNYQKLHKNGFNVNSLATQFSGFEKKSDSAALHNLLIRSEIGTSFPLKELGTLKFEERDSHIVDEY